MNKALSSLSIAMIASAIFAPVVPAHAESDVEIHGFVSQGYIKTTKENQYPVGNSGEGSYNFNDFGINFTRRLAPDLRVGLQLFTQDRGNFNNNNNTKKKTNNNKQNQEKQKKQNNKVKIPLGLYNESRDND